MNIPKRTTEMNYRKEAVFSGEGLPVKVGMYQGKSAMVREGYYHQAIEFQLITQGHGQYFIKDRVWDFRKNSLLVIHKNEIHNCLAHPDSRVKRINLMLLDRLFDGRSEAKSILNKLASVYHLALTEKEATVMEFLLSEIAEECSVQSPHWQKIVINNCETILMLLDRSGESHEPEPKENPLIREVIAYLDTAFSQPELALQDVAERFHLTPTSLSRTFKRYAGMGFKDYLNHLRIIEAKKLLSETDMKISFIALESGFNDLSAFNRNFRRMAGISPSNFRKLCT